MSRIPAVFLGSLLVMVNVGATPVITDDPDYPGYIASPPGADLRKNAIRHADGTLSIPAGQQTPEANELHRRLCESIGARDITDESDATFTDAVLDSAVCFSSGNDETPPAHVEPMPGTDSGRIFYRLPELVPGPCATGESKP